MFLRASSFAPGATASSRSRNTWSAGSPCAFPSILVLEPGTARQDRRGRSGGTDDSFSDDDVFYGRGSPTDRPIVPSPCGPPMVARTVRGFRGWSHSVGGPDRLGAASQPDGTGQDAT